MSELLFVVVLLLSTFAATSNGNCLSWRLSVETNNLRNWKLVPKECATHVKIYMEKGQYHQDCDIVADTAVEFAKTVKLAGDGKEIWVFDIDETALSNLPFYARPDVAYGAKSYNWTGLGEWIKEGKAPANPSMLKLYKELIALKYKIVFLTGANEERFMKPRISNLKNAGYTTWEKLIFKPGAEKGTPTKIFKSKKRKELETAGYRIVGNVGDQWGDLVGDYVGMRTFKLPNPMYYVA
ncbi:hypothetical protein ABFX02_14G295800 [Erythranthe guttata]